MCLLLVELETQTSESCRQTCDATEGRHVLVIVVVRVVPKKPPLERLAATSGSMASRERVAVLVSDPNLRLCTRLQEEEKKCHTDRLREGAVSLAAPSRRLGRGC